MKYSGILATLLLGGTSCASAKTASLSSFSSKPALVTRPPSAVSSVPATAELDTNRLSRSVVDKTRGGDGDVSPSLVRLKIASYFALWYILNVVYNSEYF